MLKVVSVAPIACLHFDVNIRTSAMCLVERKLVVVFVLIYFANQNCRVIVSLNSKQSVSSPLFRVYCNFTH